MRKFLSIITLIAIIWPVDFASAQTGGKRRQPNSGLNTRTARYRPSAGFTKGYAGLSFRTDQVRNLFPIGRGGGRQGLLSPLPPSYDPVFNSLYYRNPLRARSLLAQRGLGNAGRQDYVFENGRWVGDIGTDYLPLQSAKSISRPAGAKPDTADAPDIQTSTRPLMLNTGPSARPLNDNLEQQIRERSDQYLRMAKAYAMEKNYASAVQYLELYKGARPNDPMGDGAMAMLSYQMRDIHKAVFHVTMALKRMKTLDDLPLNWRDYIADPNDFRAMVNQLSLVARGQYSTPQANLLYAYFQWLNDDHVGAIVSLETVLVAFDAAAKVEEEETGQISPIERAAYVRRFHDLLVARKNQSNPDSNTTAEPSSAVK